MARMPTGCFRGGAGAPLVLLHSGFHTWVEWRCVLDGLTTVRDVMAPTLPGSEGGPELDLEGRTMLATLADHVEELLDEAGWTEPVAVVGSSYGGVVGLELGARGRASQVVALAPPWVAGVGVGFYGALFATPLAALRLTEPLHGWATARRRAGGLLHHGSLRPMAIDPADLAQIWRSAGRFPILRVARGSGLNGPGMPETERVACPVTLVWGSGDRLVPGWMHERWERALPDARVETLAGFPHQPHFRDPDRIIELIRDATAVSAG